jgi:hypothetical protein
MDILTSNLATTNKFSIELQSSVNKYKAMRVDIRDKIAAVATKQAEIMLSEKEDIGNPEKLCDEIAKLRLKYNEIIVQEKEEKKEIMDRYMNKIIENMGNPPLNSNDAIKLRIYDKYIQTQLNCWDLPNNVVVWPATGYRKSNYNSSTTGIQWLNNFRHTINTKYQEELAKIQNK